MPRKDIDITLPDISGRRIVLTGGSDGMGLIMATRLAAAGADLILPVRNAGKGEAAIATIHESAPGARVSLRSLDLSSLESVAALGETLSREGEPIHTFIGNAGVMTPPERQLTKDGFELQFGTNHLGHAALIGHILPLLREGQARVTLQISIAADQGGVNWDDLNWERSYSSMGAYSQSKRVRAVRARTRPAQQERRVGHHREPLPPRRRPHEPSRRATGDRTLPPRARAPAHHGAVAGGHHGHGRERGSSGAPGGDEPGRSRRDVRRPDRTAGARRPARRGAALLTPAEPRGCHAHLGHHRSPHRSVVPGGVTGPPPPVCRPHRDGGRCRGRPRRSRRGRDMTIARLVREAGDRGVVHPLGLEPRTH